MVKEKLTLSVDKKVVEKAKKLGINISEITERVLRGYTSAEKPEGDLYDGYKQLFDSIAPLLKEYDVSIIVAEGVETFDDERMSQLPFSIELTQEGDFWVDPFEANYKDIRKIEQSEFLPPKKILSNLVDALVRSEQTRKEKLKEILMAKRIIDAMSETLIKRGNAGE